MAENGLLRSRWMAGCLAIMSGGLLVTGCGGDDDGDGTEESPAPTQETFDGRIAFNGLENGAQIGLSYEGLTAQIPFKVDAFVLAAPGTCALTSGCGHVELLIDGEAGNRGGNDYNSTSYQLSITGYFGELDSPLGEHTITLKLVYDDGSDTGVETSITVVAGLPAPVIAITDPNPTTSTFILPDNELVPLTFTAGNVELREPGQCGTTPNCGHLYVNIDGNAGNEPGKSYNNIYFGTGTTVDAKLDYLDTPTGTHVITLGLRNDDGSAYLVQGVPVEIPLTVNITSPTDPRVSIINLDPTDEDGDGQDEAPQVDIQNDGLRSFTVQFEAQNFTFDDDCNGAAKCGHVEIRLDADNVQNPDVGNMPGEDYNNSGVPRLVGGHYEIDAHFHWIEYNANAYTGLHTVDVVLVDDNGTEILGSGIVVSDSKGATVRSNLNVVGVSIVNPNANSQGVPHTDTDDKAVNVVYAVNIPDSIDVEFNLPEDCTPVAKLCLHIRVFIDGDHGNRASGVPYNNAAAPQLVAQGFSIQALFGALEDNGYGSSLYTERHHIVVGLYDENGSPYSLDNDDGSETAVSAGTRVMLLEPQ